MDLPYPGVDQAGLLDGGAEKTEFRSLGILNPGVSVLYHGAEVGHANTP